MCHSRQPFVLWDFKCCAVLLRLLYGQRIDVPVTVAAFGVFAFVRHAHVTRRTNARRARSIGLEDGQ